MNLSVNNGNNKNISFEGVKYTYNVKNSPVLKFVVPPHGVDEKTVLELLPFNYDIYGNPEPIKNMAMKIALGDLKEFELNTKITEGLLNRTSGFMYRFKVGDKNVTDSYEKIKLGEDDFNIIKTSKNQGITPKTGAMRHSFVDSDISPSLLETLKQSTQDVPELAIKKMQQDVDFVHNHFNKLGGSLEGIDYLLTKTNELDPYRYIISTPDIGVDPTSSHKYWPNNLYQCNDINAFKNLNFHLFERGKGYVADGAFTSQSLQSPLVQHVYKWGEDSPWFKMLKVENDMKIGVLPDTEEAVKHVGVKVVNNPYGYKYDSKKPTYIQFFDDRLVDDIERNSNKLTKNTNKIPSDHYEITSNNDSVYMFAFEVSPDDKHLDVFKQKGENSVLLKDLDDADKFLTFPNFQIVKRFESGNYTAWDGNVDMVKMNLSNSSDRKAMEEARQYIYGVATYWTEGVQSDLILKTAKASANKNKKIKLKNGDLPLNTIAKNNNVDLKGVNLKNVSLPTLEQRKSIGEYIQEFPLQSIKTSPELSAIFAQPSFNKELLSSKNFASRMENIVNNVIDNAISLDKNDEMYDDYKQYVIKTYAPEIIKTVYAGALEKSTIAKNGTLVNLDNITLKSLEKYPSPSPEVERRQVINKIHSGFSGCSQYMLPLQNRIKNELKDVTLDDFKLGEYIVVQGKGGLNWRFDAAKDIGDLDAVRADKMEFRKVWDEVEDFWTNFVKNVRKYNPPSYVVNEVTDFWNFYDGSNPVSKKNFDLKLSAKDTPDIKERNFLINSASTTSSNYSSYFNKLACFVGANAEKYEDVTSRAGDINQLHDCVNAFVNNIQPDNVNLSHTFVENHDKPRVLHVMPLNQDLFHKSSIKDVNDYKKIVNDVLGNSIKLEPSDYDKISPKALAVAQIMSGQIKKCNKSEQPALNKALAELTLGIRPNDPDKIPDFKRSDAFGVTPYEVSIEDLFKRADIKNDINKKVLNFHYGMLSNSMNQQISMWEMMNAIPGTPTLFNGAEFAQTGWESASKNIYQTNRGQVLHHLKDDKRYKKYYEKMQAVSSMYKLNGLSAIRDGSKVILNPITDAPLGELPKMKGSAREFDDYIVRQVSSTKDGYNAAVEFFKTAQDDQKTYDEMYNKFGIWHDEECFNRFKEAFKDDNFKDVIEIFSRNATIHKSLPIFSYDEKGSEVLQIVTDKNVPIRQQAHEASQDVSKRFVDNIDLKNECPFEEGTILKRKVYKKGMTFSDETVDKTSAVRTYIVEEGKIKPQDNGKIEIDDTVLTFYKA